MTKSIIYKIIACTGKWYPLQSTQFPSEAPTRGDRSRYKLPGPGGPVWGPGPEYAAFVFVFLGSITTCRLYKLTLSDQAPVTLQQMVFPIYCKDI